MNEEEKKAVEYYQDKEVSFGFKCDLTTEQFLKALGIEVKEEDSFENHQIRFNTLLNLIKKQQSLLEKKDKMINLMAYDIATNDSDFCQYIDETIRCKKYAGENKLTCDECIKQYYERKVENGN